MKTVKEITVKQYPSGVIEENITMKTIIFNDDTKVKLSFWKGDKKPNQIAFINQFGIIDTVEPYTDYYKEYLEIAAKEN